MKVYKGTDKNMQCRGKQYVLGKKEVADGAIRCGNKGFHSCEAPFDVLRYYPNINGNRFFEAEAGGKIDKAENDDTKLASSELTLKSEINFAGLVKAQIEYTRKKSNAGTADGDWSNLVGGDGSKLLGGYESNLVGGDWSNLLGGNGSNLMGGYKSNLLGGYKSNLVCGNESNLAGGNSSLIIGRNGCNVKGGLHSVIVLTEWKYDDNGNYVPIAVKAEIVDGVRIKADTWYKLKNGELVEADV